MPVTNASVVLDPLEQSEEIVLSQQEDDSRFGMDFPSLIDAPLISEDGPLDDPVTTGGDASTYGNRVFGPAGAGGQ